MHFQVNGTFSGIRLCRVLKNYASFDRTAAEICGEISRAESPHCLVRLILEQYSNTNRRVSECSNYSFGAAPVYPASQFIRMRHERCRGPCGFNHGLYVSAHSTAEMDSLNTRVVKRHTA